MRDRFLDRTWLFPERLACTAKLALLHADRRPPENLGAEEARDLALVILGVVDVFESKPPSSGLSEEEEHREHIKSLGLQSQATSTPDPLTAVGRTHRIFGELPTEAGTLIDDADIKDLESRLQAETGLTLARYTAICAAVAVRFLSWNRNPDNWRLTAGYFASVPFQRWEVDRVLDDLSATPEQLRVAFEDERVSGKSLLRYPGTLLRYPLCQLAKEFVPLYPSLLVQRLLGDGLYWRLYSLYARSERTRFGSSVGRLFERYVQEAVEAALPDAYDVFREKGYGRGRLGPDLAVREGRRIALIEIGADRLHVAKTLHEGDLDSLKADIETVVDRAAQVDKKIRALRSGELRYGTDDIRGALVFPIVVLYDGFPQGLLLSDTLRSAISESEHLKGEGIGPLSVLSPDDLDALLSVVERAGPCLFDALSRWHGDARGRHESLRDFLIRTAGIDRPRVVVDAFDRATASWTRELMLQLENPRAATD